MAEPISVDQANNEMEGAGAIENPLEVKLRVIRVDNATKMGSVIDVARLVTDLDANNASKYAQKAANELGIKLTHLKINGKGRTTPVATAKQLIQLIWALGGKKAKAFRMECANYICRVLGGDPDLVREMEIRAEHTPEEQREFFMQGVERPGWSRPAIESYGDPTYLTDRCDSADGTNVIRALIAHTFEPKHVRTLTLIVQAKLSDIVLGEWPRAFKEHNNIDQTLNGPDFMLKEQLRARQSMQDNIAWLIRNKYDVYKNTDGMQFLKDLEIKYQAAKQLYEQYHGHYQQETELAEVRRLKKEQDKQQPGAIVVNGSHNTFNINNY